MGRFVLVAYLSLTVSCGPALCCCTAHELFPWACETGCCGSSEANHASHSHHDHSHHRHGDSLEAPQVAHNAGHEQQAPCDHNKKDCPCGRHHQTFLASQSCDGTAVKSLVDGHSPWMMAFDVSVSTLPQIEAHLPFAATRDRHGDLSSREILRAHHRLQC